jgi:hypothetical protein
MPGSMYRTSPSKDLGAWAGRTRSWPGLPTLGWVMMLGVWGGVQGCCLPIPQTVEHPDRAWENAFHEPVPDGVQVRRGRYWNSGHFSGEYAWFFEIAPNEPFVKDLVARKRATKDDAPDAAQRARLDTWLAPPTWFAPEDRSYRVYRSEHLSIFVQTDDQAVFISNWSV